MRSWAVLGHEAATWTQSTTTLVHIYPSHAYERDADAEARRVQKGGNSYHTTVRVHRMIHVRAYGPKWRWCGVWWWWCEEIGNKEAVKTSKEEKRGVREKREE